MTLPSSLPLTPFERYMLADDQPGFPMVSVLQLDFGGRLEEQLLVDALAPALALHPLLGARVRGTGLAAHWQWDGLTPVEQVLQFFREETERTDGNVPLDLEKSCGLRIQVRQQAEGTSLRVLVHHAVADGVGSMQFLADWLGIYDVRFRGLLVHPLPARAPDGLLGRGQSRWILAEPVTRWRALRSFFVEASRWLLRRPQVLCGDGTTAPPQCGPYELLHETFTNQETQQLRRVATDQKATLNDVLLRDLFLTLAHWQSNGSTRLHRQWLRINMPQNLRLPHEPEMPACNVIGYAFLTRQHRDCQDPALLLADISRETAAIRRWNLGQFFLDGLAKAERLPGVVRWFTKSRRSMATTVLSNLGDVRHYFRHVLPRRGRWYYAGDATLVRLLAAPPVRPGTHAAFLASTCGDELTISFRAHPARLAAHEQTELLSLYAEALRKTAAKRPG